MTARFLWPRLPRGAALQLLSTLEGRSMEAIREEARLSHPMAAPIATGGARVPEPVIAGLQSEVRALAEKSGWPKPVRRGAVGTFDQPCSLLLHEAMEIIPADAAHEGPWSFLALVVLPDVAVWRFRDMAGERMVGAPRNVFRRLWWRVEVLGRSLSERGDALGEDELVQIMERPSLAANPAIARAIAERLLSEPGVGVARSELMRDLSKRVLRLMPVVCLDALSLGELRETVDAACRQSISLLGVEP